MHVSTADVGDTGWLQAESVENSVVTEPLKAALLKCWPHFVQDLSVEMGTYSEIVYAVGKAYFSRLWKPEYKYIQNVVAKS